VLRLIAAIDNKLGIAGDEGIPWQGLIPGDAAYFREKTTTGDIVMGFRTYTEFDRPLHDRDNYVLDKATSGSLRKGFVRIDDLGAFLSRERDGVVWVIGGGGLYAQTIALAQELFITQLDRDFHCTKFFPEFRKEFTVTSRSAPQRENDITYRFEIWRREQSV
jgi:dihydrofolate reductase